MDTNEQTILKLRAALKREMAESQVRANRDDAQLNEISRINNELVNAQRDLASMVEAARQNAANLKVSEVRYRRLFESAKDGILILDAVTGKIEDVNPYLCQLLGFVPDDFVGKQLWEIGTFHDIAANQNAFRELQAKEYIRHDDLPLETKDGQSVSVEFISNVYVSGDKKVIQCNIRDITGRKQAEKSIRESNEKFLQLANNITDVFWVSSPDMLELEYLSPSFEATWGRSLETLNASADGGIEYLVAEDRAHVMEALAALTHDAASVTFEYRIVRPDGEERWILTKGFQVRNAEGELIRLTGISSDITERQQTEIALRRSESLFRALVQNSWNGFQLVQPDGQITYESPTSARLLGYSAEEMEGHNALEFVHPDDAQQVMEGGQALLESPGKTRTVVLRIRHKDGSWRWIESYEINLLDHPDVGAITANYHDITERKAAEEERDRFFTLSLDMLAIIGSDGYFKRLNPAFEATLGFSNAELRAVPFLEFVHPDDIASTLSEIAKLESGTKVMRFENRYRCQDGSYKWLQWMAAPFEELWYCVAHDVTETKRTQQVIRESEDYFRFLNDLSEATRTLADPEQIMAVMSRMLGEHLSVSRCAYADVEADGEEFTILHDYTDGCASTVGKYKLSLFGPRAVATLNSGETLIIRNVEEELLPDEGAAMFDAIGIQAIITCPLVKKGVLRAMMAVHQTTPRDWQPSEITLVQDVVERCWSTIERRSAEERIYELNADLEQRVIQRTSQLEEANKSLQIAREAADTANQAKSEFLSRMSHELRTPLNAILGFGQILEMDDMPPRRRENVQHILKGGRHLLDLINEVLDISRIEVGHLALSLEPVPVDTTVRAVLDLVRPLTVEGNVQLINEIPPHSDWCMLGDRQRLTQTLLNLVSNAIKYNRDGGSVTIVGEEVSREAISGQGGEQRRVLRLSIRDTGNGLSKGDIARLFVPFERLGAAKTRIEGTGIGLALSKRLVEVMGGQIGVWSTPGQGSTFWIELPLVPNPLHSAIEMPEPSALQTMIAPEGEPKTVLYIEDNLANVRLIEMLLEARPNVRLLTAMQGSTGLDLAFEHSPDLILLDLHLPDINGDEVLRRLQANTVTRSTPVVMISADATLGQIERLLAAGAKTYLTKPLNVKEFLSVLKDCLKAKE